MSKLIAGVTVTVVTAGIFLFAGCESKDKLSNGSLEMGDSNSQEFQDFKDVANGIDDVGGEIVNGIFEQSGMILQMNSSSASKDRLPFGGRFASAVTDSFTAYYNDESKYWHAYWSYSNSEEGTSAIVQDSIQFREGNTAVQWPDTLLITEIRCGQLITVHMTGDSGSIVITASSDWTISGEAGAIPSGGEIKINGNVNHQVEANGLTSGCSTELNMTAVYDDITSTMPQLQSSETCPTAGSVHLHGTASSQCESEESSGSFDGTWDWRATFHDGTVSIHVNNGTYEWSFEGPCGGDSQPLD